MYINESEIQVYIIDMPCTTNEYITLNEDGSYSLFLNARASYEMHRASYQHALRHIQGGDFYKNTTVQEIEKEAHEEH